MKTFISHRAFFTSLLVACVSTVCPAAAPADQDFASATGGTGSITVAGVTYSVLTGAGAVASGAIIDTESPTSSYFDTGAGSTGNALVADANWAAADVNARRLSIASANQADNFRIVKLFAGVPGTPDITDATQYEIDAYDDGVLQFTVTGIDFGSGASSALQASYGSGPSAISLTSPTNTANLHSAVFNFNGSGWGNIDQLVFRTIQNLDIIIAIDSIDFEAPVLPPIISNLNGDSVVFIEKGSVVLLDSGGNATVTDGDSLNFDTGNVTVAITANRVVGEDVLAINSQGTEPGQIGVAEANITYGGVLIGTFTGGTGTSDLVVTLNAGSDPTSVQALVRNLTYRNSNTSDPTTTARTVRITISDGDGGTSSNADVTVGVTAVNDEPTLTATGAAPTFTEGGSAVDLFSSVTVSAVEVGQTLKSMTLTVTNVNDGSNEVLTFDGSAVQLTNGFNLPSTATNGLNVSVSLAGSTATVSFNGATLTPAQLGTLIDGLAYKNNSATPSFSNRVVTLTQLVDSGGADNGGDDTAALAIAATVAIQAIDNDGNLTAAGGVTEPVGLASTKDNVGAAVEIFDFTLSDAGAPGDGLALTVSQIVVHVSGTSTDADRGKVTWRLNGTGVNNVEGTYDAGADTLTFAGLSLSVANGGSETYTINAFYNDNTGLTDGRTFILSLDGDTDLTVGASGTQMGATAAVTNGTGSTIDVVASAMVFTTQPAGSVSGLALTTQPIVAAQDAFGNIDTGFTETITLTEASAGALTNNTQAALNGVATYTNLTYTATADQQSFTLTANDDDGVGSNLPTVAANAVTSDVVATKLVFQTQPAPLTTHSGVALDFTTDPIVQALDANNVVDTGWATGVMLTEVNGAGSAVVSVTDDTDGSAATATITPASGVATFTNLVVTYTNSGAAGETFNLRASSGALTTADSSQITSSGLPALTSATYNAGPGVLVVTGTDFEAKAGLANDVDVSQLTFTGEGGGTHALTDSGDVEIDSATQFTVTLSATDQSAVNLILNKNGLASTGGTTYNLAAADDFITNVTGGNTADLVGNGITVSDVAVPAITSAAYDYAANTLTLTGTGFLSRAGALNDVDVSALTITGEGGATYTLSTTADVDLASGTTAIIILSGADVPQVEALLNKDGTTSATSATVFNLAAAEDWNIGADTAANIADATSPVTVSNFASPAITSATYDASTGVLVVTGTNFVSASGATNDVDASLLTLRGGDNEVAALTDTPDVEVASATAFTLTLSAVDKLSVNGVLNKNGLTSGSGSTYNLEAADNWMAGSPAANDIADTTGNGITVSNTQAPTLTSVTYDRTTGIVVVTGTNFVRKPGAANDVDLSTLTFTGGIGNATYTLTTATDVEITSATSFTVTLSGADRTSIDVLLDQLGTTSSGGSTYNLAAADNWLTGADPSTDTADAGPNAITVTVPPSITSATYNATTGVLVVTGANFQANGSGADIDASKLTLTGEGGATYALTDSPDVERDSLSQFTVTLSATDKAAVNQMLNKNGPNSTGGTSYNLAAADDYITAMTDGNTTDDTNALTVSNVAVPSITSATYNASTGVLTVTGTGFLSRAGDTNDVDASKLTLTGQAGATYTLTSASVEISSGTAFSITLNPTDRMAVTPLLNQNGTMSLGGTTYNVAAAEDWAAGADLAVNVADMSGNGVTVTNADSTAPLVTGVTSSTDDGSYKAGTAVSIQVNFSENVYVTGTPQLTLETGSTDRVVDYASGSGSSSLTFTYTVQAGDTSADLDYVATSSLALNGGSIRDLTGNNAMLTLASPGAAGSLGANKALVIDTTAPMVSTIARYDPATFNTIATTVTWRVTFAEAVTGVDDGDFAVTLLDGVAAGAVVSVTPQSALIYDVDASVSGQGALRLDLNANDTGIVDLAGNAIVGGFAVGDAYIVGVANAFDTLNLLSDGLVSVGTGKVAQRFTTAADEPLTLSTLTVAIGAVTDMPDPAPDPVVTIHADDGGAPAAAELDTLDNPAVVEGNALNVWTGSVVLEPSKTYWIVFATTEGSFQIAKTAAAAGGEGAWLASAADYVYRTHDGLAWAAPTVGALQIALGATSTPVITSSLTASGTYGTAFSYQITASNSPTSFAATGLPSGLSLNAATGVISGTPTQAQTTPFTVVLSGTNASGTGPTADLALTIAKAPLTVTVNNTTRYVGYANPTFTLSYSGFRNGDTAANLTTAPTATTTATNASPVGTYPITPAGGVSDNYDFSYVNGTLTVSVEPPPSKQAQTITFAPLGNAVIGDVVSLSASASSGLPVSFSLVSGPATLSGSTVTSTGIGVVTVRATQAGNASYDAATAVVQSFTVGLPIPTVTTPTQVPAPEPGGTATLTVPTPLENATYQWRRNGEDLTNATTSTLTLTGVQPPSAGLYTYTVQTPGGASATSEPVIVGVATTEKVAGTGDVVNTDIQHPNGNIYDQLILEGAGASLTADPGQITRMSFVDLSDDIVQVEFSGAGTLSLVMDNAPAGAPAANYNQPGVDYVRGNVGIVITGADETTNVSVISVGRITAVNQTLFRDDVAYDGVANIAFIAIQSTNGRFGGVYTGNVEYFASQGYTGLYAPGVVFNGPVNIGDIQAHDNAQPVLVVGSAPSARITGGNLAQPNGQPVTVNGLTQLTMVPGQTSQGDGLPAQTNQGVLEQDGVDVTDLIVAAP